MSAREVIAKAIAGRWAEKIDDATVRVGPPVMADAILSALREAGMVIGCIGFPGEIVAGVIQVAQRAQDYNGELVSIRVRTTEPGNVEIETDDVTIALDRVDATRLAALLLRESAMIAAAEEEQS